MGFQCRHYRAAHREHRRGFSLVELIVALGVISVAGTVFLSMYGSSVRLAKTARDRTVATQLAEEQMGDILRSPERYLWHVPVAPEGQRFPVTAGPDDPKAGVPCEAPKAMPTMETPHRRESVVYDQFRWRAEGRLPDPNAAYYEVTVSIHWTDAGRPQMLSITSCVPRARVRPVAAASPETPPAQATEAQAS